MTDEYRKARESAVVFDVSSRGKVEVAGPESGMLLHNLSTNDIKSLDVGAGCEAFFATSTAKAVEYVSIFHVLLHGGRDGFLIDVEPGRSESLIRHLDRHTISEQVEFADRTGEFAQFRLAGPRAKDVLEKSLLDEQPDLKPLQHMVRTFGTIGHSSIRRIDALGVPGYDILCLSALGQGVMDILVRAGATPAGMDVHELLRVEAGTPVYGADIDENRFIVEVGRTSRAISYNKGCYLGQEPVVMARDRGQVQRTFLGLKLSGTSPVPSGSRLFREGKEVGVTTSSIVSPSLGRPIALAYVKRGSQEPGTTVEVEVGTERIAAEVTALPFVE